MHFLLLRCIRAVKKKEQMKVECRVVVSMEEAEWVVAVITAEAVWVEEECMEVVTAVEMEVNRAIANYMLTTM